MIVRRLITVMEYKVDRPSEKKTESSFNKLKKAATGLAAVLSAGLVATAFRRLIVMGSDAAETMNVINESFEQNTSTVLEWARVQAEVLGRSEFALREYAATLGAMLNPMTGSADAAAEMSTTLAALTVDLGSFFNAAESDVLTALKSGLTGASEPMRRFGVVMTQASLDAFALERGIGKTVKQMSEAEKVTLRYQFILAKTSKAQGDAARTAKGFANLSKTLVAVLSDIGTEVGLVLMPSIESALDVLVTFVREIKGPVISTVKRVTTVVGALANKTTLIIAGITAATIALKTFGTAALVAWLKVTAPALAALILFGLIGLAIFAIIEDLEAMGEGGESAIGGLIGEFQHWMDETDSVVASIGQMLLTAFEFWGQKFAELFGDEIVAEFDRLTGMIDKFLKKIAAFFRGEFSLSDLIWGEGADFDKFLTNLKRDIGEFSTTLARDVDKLARGDLAGYAADLRGDIFGATATASPMASAAAGAGAGLSSQQNIEVNVQAQPGMNEAQLAAQTGAATGRAVDAANRRTAQRLAVGGGT